MSKILIVDDESHIRIFLQSVLEQQNLQTVATSSAEEAINLLQKDQFDCVISDIFLEGKSGLELIGDMKRKKIKLPVILITGYPDVESAQLAVKHKAYDYLTKPIKSADLITCVKNALKQRQIELDTISLEKKQKQYNQQLEKEVKKRISELHESEERFKNIVEQSLIGVYILQKNKLKYANKKYYEILGNNNKASHLDLALLQYKPLLEKNLNDLISGANNFNHYTFTIKSKDGRENDLEVWESKLIYDGKPAIQGFVSDITDKRIYTEREKEYELKLMQEHKMAAIGQLAAGVAHNLNTPLSVILGNCDLIRLQQGDSDELEKISRQAEKMSEIIQGLLTKNRLEQDRQVQKINLNKLLQTELDFLNSNLDYKHNIKKEFKFKEDLPELYAVYSDFSQSLMNIIHNAIDAMYERKLKILKIETDFDTKNLTIRISDSGCGIEDSDSMKLFDPFYTTKPGPDERKGNEPTGIGLGLSTVYNLLTPYGVEINFNSRKNEGTEVVLNIPYKTINDNHAVSSEIN